MEISDIKAIVQQAIMVLSVLQAILVAVDKALQTGLLKRKDQ